MLRVISLGSDEVGPLAGQDHVFTVDPAGTIYLAYRQNIYKIDKGSTKPILLPSSLHIINRGFLGIAWGPPNTLYLSVISVEQEGTQVFDYTGIWEYNLETLEHKWLIRGEKGNCDGCFEEATFMVARQLTMDSEGALYVADFSGIRKVDLKARIVETVANSPPQTWSSHSFYVTLHILRDGTFLVQRASTEWEKYGFLTCIWEMNIQEGTFTELPLPEPSFLQAHFVTQDLLLFCTNDGVYKARLSTQQITRIAYGSCTRLYVDTQNRILVAGVRFMAEVDFWKLERVLWIGLLKNDPSDCLLASLPKDILMKEVIPYLRIVQLPCTAPAYQ